MTAINVPACWSLKGSRCGEYRERIPAMRDHTEHLIHNRDGQIHERNSYGHDPYPPTG